MLSRERKKASKAVDEKRGVREKGSRDKKSTIHREETTMTRKEVEAMHRRMSVLSESIMLDGERAVSLGEVVEVCSRSREALLAEPPLLRLLPPLAVFGDIHGQIDDLRTLLSRVATPPKQRLLFLGDYVDRGSNGLQTIILLLAMKIRFPDGVYLLRGNHETRLVSRNYGFFEECLSKYGKETGLEVWTHVQQVFNCLPLAAVVGGRIFCVHGGISDSLISFNQFDRIVRPVDVADVGLVTDLLWSDPSDSTDWFSPSHRGASNVFGRRAISSFCHNLGIDLIVRAHQCVEDGFSFFCPSLLTIFSAPSYGGSNAAAVLKIDQDMSCQILTYRNEGVDAPKGSK